ncbi:MAG: lysozyme inhibitor LprI family protein [Pseudomonadota bacterium]
MAGTEDGSARAAVAACLAAAEPDPAARRACAGIYATVCMESPEGQTTVGMSQCLGEELAVWEEMRAETWKALRADAKQADAAYPEAEALPTLRRARRAWTAYREAECRAAAAPYSGGTIYGLIVGNCTLTLTAERVVAQRARLLEERNR